MKILVACFLMSALGLAFAKSPFPKDINKEFIKKLIMFPTEGEEESALKQTVVSSENDQDTEDDDNVNGDEDIATLQGIFNVLTQVEVENAKAMQEKKTVTQFWGSLGNALWNVGKHHLKKRYCQKDREVEAMIEELIVEQEIPDENNEDTEDGDTKALAELQTLFSAMKKAEAKVMQNDWTGENYAKAEGWWKKTKRWVNRKAKRLTRKYLC